MVESEIPPEGTQSIDKGQRGPEHKERGDDNLRWVISTNDPEELERRLNIFYEDSFGEMAKKFDREKIEHYKLALLTPENVVGWLKHPKFDPEALREHYDPSTAPQEKKEFTRKVREILGIEIISFAELYSQDMQLGHLQHMYGYKTLLEYCLEQRVSPTIKEIFERAFGQPLRHFSGGWEKGWVADAIQKNPQKFIEVLTPEMFRQREDKYSEGKGEHEPAAWWTRFLANMQSTRLWLRTRGIETEKIGEFGSKYGGNWAKYEEETGELPRSDPKTPPRIDIYKFNEEKGKLFEYLIYWGPEFGPEMETQEDALLEYITRETMDSGFPKFIVGERGELKENPLYNRDEEAIAVLNELYRYGLDRKRTRIIFRKAGILGIDWTNIERYHPKVFRKEVLSPQQTARLLLMFLDKENLYYLFKRDESEYRFFKQWFDNLSPEYQEKRRRLWEYWGRWSADDFFNALCALAMEVDETHDVVSQNSPNAVSYNNPLDGNTYWIHKDVYTAIEAIKNDLTGGEIASFQNPEGRKTFLGLLTTNKYLFPTKTEWPFFWLGRRMDLSRFIYMALLKKAGVFNGEYKFKEGPLGLFHFIDHEARKLCFQYGDWTKEKGMMNRLYKTNYEHEDKLKVVDFERGLQYELGEGFGLGPDDRPTYAVSEWNPNSFLCPDKLLWTIKYLFNYSSAFRQERRGEAVKDKWYILAFSPRDYRDYLISLVQYGLIQQDHLELLRNLVRATPLACALDSLKMAMAGIVDTKKKAVPGMEVIKGISEISLGAIPEVSKLLKTETWPLGASGLQIGGLLVGGIASLLSGSSTFLIHGFTWTMGMQLFGNSLLRGLLSRPSTPEILETHDCPINPDEQAARDYERFSKLPQV